MHKMTQAEYEASIAWARVVAGCVIKNDEEKYLLVQEAQKSAYGLWNIPAGHVDKDEVIEDAAIREAKEETGYDVKLGDKIGIYHDKVEEPVRHAFRAYITGGNPKAQPDEILAIGWFSYKEITDMKNSGKLRVAWIYDAISRVENE